MCCYADVCWCRCVAVVMCVDVDVLLWWCVLLSMCSYGDVCWCWCVAMVMCVDVDVLLWWCVLMSMCCYGDVCWCRCVAMVMCVDVDVLLWQWGRHVESVQCSGGHVSWPRCCQVSCSSFLHIRLQLSLACPYALSVIVCQCLSSAVHCGRRT